MVESIITMVVVFGLVIAGVTVGIVFAVRRRSKYVYAFNSHEIVIQFMSDSTVLLVDGQKVDEFATGSISSCVLHATVDGQEVSARIEFGYRTQVEITAGGIPLSPVGKKK